MTRHTASLTLQAGYTIDGVVKVREVIRMIEADGWVHMRTTGSHRHFRHPRKRGIVTVPGHMADDIHPKTLRSVLRQAQLERER